MTNHIKQCRLCQAHIIWVTTKAGRSIPVDAKPRSDGNIVLRNDRALFVSKNVNPRPGEFCYVSHYQTCPQSDEWHKGSPDD